MKYVWSERVDVGTPRPAGIAVRADSDDTTSSAVGDYASFRACRS